MMTDARLTGYLNRAAAHELGAVQQYLAQARLLHYWGIQDLAQQFEADAQEELTHFSLLADALVSLGSAPQAGLLPAARLGRTLQEMLVLNCELEVAAIRLYEEAAGYCARWRDARHQELFAHLARDEAEHLQMLEQMLHQSRAA